MEKTNFPDLLKAGLKEGDNIYSYLYGNGKIGLITKDNEIITQFSSGTVRTNQNGIEPYCKIPSIHLTEWNPIIGEPFPFPKWNPTKGEWCAFWDRSDIDFVVAKYEKTNEKGKYCTNNLSWNHCAPISEAMEIFGVK